MKKVMLSLVMLLTLGLGACAHRCGGHGGCKDGSCKMSDENKKCGCAEMSKENSTAAPTEKK